MRAIAAILLALALGPVFAQRSDYVFIATDDPSRDRLFYLLSLLSADPTASAALEQDPVLKVIVVREAAAMRLARSSCQQSARCVAERLMLKSADIDAAGEVLARLAAPGEALNHIVVEHLRPSGLFQLYASSGDRELMLAAWRDTARGVNRLYQDYAVNAAWLNPGVDSGQSDERLGLDLSTVLETRLDTPRNVAFFGLWSRVALDLLVIHRRDEASRYGPLALEENAAAFAKAKDIDWSAYQYAAIVVPGDGPSVPDQRLSPVSVARLRLAVRRYRQGLAPFLLVSGGHISPPRTPWDEAIEMKRHLVELYHLAADAMIVDPYATTTITNLRNATRMLYRAGVPLEKPVLVTTTRDQANTITAPEFSRYCVETLGYEPQIVIKRLSANDVVMRPSIRALQADAGNAFDP